jgi:pimeloyl-ACP methyl ester carboxylesterase
MTVEESKRESGVGPAGGYASVNGLRLYYEIQGTGKPLVLLHGGVGASEMFGPLVQPLAAQRQLIAVHLQGHGRTADVDRPLRFESMADDVAALLEHLDYPSADFMGYSLGGGVALQTAIRHPDALRKLVLVSTPFKRQGFYPEVLAGMAQMGPEAARFMPQSPLARLYPDTDWGTLFTKLGELLGREYDWSQAVAGIRSPTMLVFADADAVSGHHMMDFYALLGGGLRDAGLDGSARPMNRLAVLPGATHYDVLGHPLMASVVTSFLEAAVPESVASSR